ncbi:MAG TPA: hypothetical protein EYP90_05640, partial [Chromatiaceae bacterium]|nr:hypothetical protein [Chromatiaceae bacterium]
AEAIAFELQTGGRAQPRVDEQLCNGCGECLAVCPENAVSLRTPSTLSTASEDPR